MTTVVGGLGVAVSGDDSSDDESALPTAATIPVIARRKSVSPSSLTRLPLSSSRMMVTRLAFGCEVAAENAASACGPRVSLEIASAKSLFQFLGAMVSATSHPRLSDPLTLCSFCTAHRPNITVDGAERLWKINKIKTTIPRQKISNNI